MRLTGWATGFLGPIALSGVLVAIRSEFFTPNAALMLVIPVLVAAVIGGRLGGVISACVAAVCFDFLFTRPYYSLTINSRDDIETTLVLLVVGLVVGELVVRTRHSQQIARAGRREIEQIRTVAELAAGGGRVGRLIGIVEHEIVELLGARGARFERPPFRTALPSLGHENITIPGPPTDGRPVGARNELEIPVWGGRREIGRLVIVLAHDAVGVAIAADDRALTIALTDQLGALLAAGEPA